MIPDRVARRRPPRRARWPGLALISLVPLTAAQVSWGDPGPESNPAPSGAVPTNVAIPFKFRRGHVMLPARVNGSAPLSFVLDTGYGITVINPDHAETLQLRRVGQMTIDGIAGEETAAVFAGATFDFAGAVYAPPRVAALPSDRERRARYRDGVLGHGFFRRFVVEIQPQTGIVNLREPQTYRYSGPGEIVPLHFRHSIPTAEATIVLPGRPPIKAVFEIDTGCDGGLCLGHDFVEANQLLPPDEKTRGGTREGVGGDTTTREGHLPRLELGRLFVENPEANFFVKGSPADPGLAGHIGIQVLRRFNVIFDYARQRMILEPLRSPAEPAAPGTAPK
ncbi:MAG: aspartyl protease family protein [Limisphaerales bacterium]